MRLRHPDGSLLHLAYCTNVHPAEDLDGVAHQLSTVASRVREVLEVPRLGIGLWLAADAVGPLRQDPSRVHDLRDVLDRHGLEVVTLNGFPYGGFHDPVVKHAVYRPDWTDAARVDHTIDLAHVLVDLLPDDVEVGSISTLPLGWRAWMDEDDVRAGRAGLERLGEALSDLHDRTGRTVRVGLEHEPGCVLDTAASVTDELAKLAIPSIAPSLDACHLAVEFEEPAEVAAGLRALDAGPDALPPAIKLQVSNALRLTEDELPRRHELLDRYVEPRFLHQTRERGPDGVLGVDDLDQALDGQLPAEHEWRVHVHVPVHASEGTTQDVLRDTLAEVVGGPRALAHHLEVETYTWTVLPADRRPTTPDELAHELANELAWTRDQLLELGCKETP
jgi:sugar phosphate isomerase/epimerase